MLWWVAGLIRAVEERRAPEPILLRGDAGLGQPAWRLHPGPAAGRRLRARGAGQRRDLVERKMIFLAWLKFGVAALLVSCITPYGSARSWSPSRSSGWAMRSALIDEWKSPDFQTQPLTELILLIALYLVLARGVKLPVMRLLIVVGLVHMFLRHVRNAELLATLAPLAIAPVLAREWPAIGAIPRARCCSAAFAGPASLRRSALGLALAVVYIVGLVRFAGIRPPEATMPTAAIEYAREAGVIKGHVLNHYGYGGYLISLGIPTFIDGRGELYGGEFIKKYVEATHLAATIPNLLEKTLDALGHRLDAAAQGAAGQQAARHACRAGVKPTATTRRRSSCASVDLCWDGGGLRSRSCLAGSAGLQDPLWVWREPALPSR